MGVLATGSANARPSCSPPIDTRRNFPAHVYRVTFKNLPQPLRSHIRSFGTLGQLLNLPPLSPQICGSAGGRGGPRLFWLIGILIFLLLMSPCKNLKAYDNPFWSFEQRHEERKKKINYLKYWPPSFPPAAQGSAHTLLGPIISSNFVSINLNNMAADMQKHPSSLAVLAEIWWKFIFSSKGICFCPFAEMLT